MTETQRAGIAKQFAGFSLALRYENLPPEVIVVAKNGILDLLGVALLGSREESTRMLLRACAEPDKGSAATAIGTGTMTTPTVAALVNAYAAHALDYDDTQHNCGTHMSVAVLPAALALAETLHRSGRELLTAYVVGFEIGCRLGRVASFGRHLHRHGIHGTGFLGHFGAAAAAGKLMGLDALQMRRSFGIAGSQAAGLLRSLGTMCKPLNAANAAQDAVFSALLAKQGFTGPEEIFDGEHNIFSVSGGQTDPEELVRGLGQQFEISSNTIKAFACSGGRNPIAEALILLAITYELQPQHVEKIDVRLCAGMMRIPNYPEPRTGLEGKFSNQHVAAVALVDRAAGIEQFTDERVAESVLVKTRRRVTIEGDEGLEPFQVRVLVRTTDGRELSHFIGAQKGDPRNPMSRDELVAKFRANASTVLPQGQVQRLVAMIGDLEAVGDIAELMRVCRLGQAPI